MTNSITAMGPLFDMSFCKCIITCAGSVEQSPNVVDCQ